MKTRYNPNEEGNVYVISNKAIVNPETKNPLTKIGRTNKKNPEDRINSMNKETPVPQNFDINGIVKTNAPNIVEKTAHKYFENEHFNKEYFNVNPEKALETVKSISEDVEQHSFCLPDTSCDIPEGEETFLSNGNYELTNSPFTPFSDAVYVPEQDDCPKGLDKDKWKKIVDSINKKNSF